MVYDGVSLSLRAEENLHATLFAIRLVEQFVHDKGRWPASWDELEGLQFPNSAPSPLNGERSVLRIGGQHGYEWPGQAEHLKECVTIEFQIDHEFVARQDPMEFTVIKPIGPYYEYRGYGFVQSLQRTLKMATEAKSIHPDAVQFLKIMEDTNQSAVARAEAAFQLAKVADASCVDRLIALLPGEWDSMTHHIIYILGTIGDRRALPVLVKMEQDESVDKPGKINVALENAIQKLRQQQTGQKTATPANIDQAQTPPAADKPGG